MSILNFQYFEELSDTESMSISGGKQSIEPPQYDLSGEPGISTPIGATPTQTNTPPGPLTPDPAYPWWWWSYGYDPNQYGGGNIG